MLLSWLMGFGLFVFLLVPAVRPSSAACADTSMSPRTVVYACARKQIRDKCADQGYTDILDMRRLKVWIPAGRGGGGRYHIYIYIYTHTHMYTCLYTYTPYHIKL